MPKKSRKTRQKESIESSIGDFEALFTAEELHAKIREKNRAIGIATVYRCLKSLSSQGKVHSYICSNRRLYSKESCNHCHFICRECGNTGHFEIKNIDFLKKCVVGQACHFQLDVHGICRKCLGKPVSAV